MPDSKRPSDWRDQWDLLQRESVTLAAEAKALQGLPADDPRVEAQEGALAALHVKKEAIAHAAWLTAARDHADVLLLAEIAWDFHWGLAGVATFPALPGDIDDRPQAEVAVAYLLRAIADVARAQLGPTEGSRSTQPRRDWLALLRDAGPDGAAPDARHAAIWGAILDLRGCRDAIENTIEQMTEKLDRLADATTLTHAIAAGWEPPEADEPEPEEDAGPKPPA
jgi:hypothetical protein